MRYGMVDFSKCHQSYEKTIGKVVQIFFETLLDKTTKNTMKSSEEESPLFDLKDFEMNTIDGMTIKLKTFMTRHNLSNEFDQAYGITGLVP